jgi:hypothetical protein
MNANQEEKGQARDGHDNTGTQGYDSLQDAGYTGPGEGRKADAGTGTGSSSEDFHEVPPQEKQISDEDHALDSGI